MPRRSEPERPHDVLVPEEFPIGTADAETPEARARRVAPPDPSVGRDEPRDVLVPEEFPIGTADAPHREAQGEVGRERRLIGVLTGAVALAVVLRLRRR